MIIRAAKNSDIDQMTLLLKELFAIEEDFVFDELKQRNGLELLLRNTGHNKCVFVAEYKTEIIGMCSMQTVISTSEGDMAGIVEDVVVAEAYRSHMVGRRLMAALEQWAKENGIRRIQLLADKNNIPALRFYFSGGWNQTKLICLRKYLK
jgi:ribosomal protein S18 acetylase RimI-like enzyme